MQSKTNVVLPLPLEPWIKILLRDSSKVQKKFKSYDRSAHFFSLLIGLPVKFEFDYDTSC